ncbi:MAG: hypothetical protein CME59_13900 [Halioglobus sp.]|nr:hypothetical protein [Halioglobus sp.]|tara:strand:- start:411 stop:2621 length:2211 start_codon:yes stop_codon:yes gene_type:complete
MLFARILPALALLTPGGHALAQCGGPVPLLCDTDGDFAVGIEDIHAIRLAAGSASSGPGDLRDIDGDGMITLADARQCSTRCAQPQCASAVEGPFAAAREAFVDTVIEERRSGTYGALAHLYRGVAPPPGSFDADLDKLNSRDDTADFALPGLMTVLAKHANNESLDSDQRQLIEDAVLNFRYWPDELREVPGTTDKQNMVSWTENHYILFAAGGYLAGQLYPEQVFPASGRTGQEMMAVFKPRILRWLELRYRSGFSEWLSNVYYPEDMSALLALIDLAQDPELVDKSRIVLDTLFADIALNSFNGFFSSTHGRTYRQHKMNGSYDATRGIMHLIWGLNRRHPTSKATTMLALSERYRVPEVLRRIATDTASTPMENRQRMGIRMEQAADWGLDVNSVDDGMALLTMEPYTHPLFIDTFHQLLYAYDWWDNSSFRPFRAARAELDNPDVRAFAAQFFEWDITRNMRPEVNIYTYRTPHYMLSTAQDWRKGFGGDQSSIWQATLGAEAVSFTTHPGSEDYLDAGTPSYWVGYGTLPRAAQVRNVVISLYDVDTREGLIITEQPLYTHAFLPRAKFDDSGKEGSWFFARKGEAYLALWSSDPDADWIPAAERGFGGGDDYDIIANGEKTIWLCELGDASAYGDYASFKAAIRAAPVEADTQALSIRYRSPSQGLIEMGWDGPVLHNGVAVPLDDYARYDNPWSQAAFPARDITFTHGGSYLRLNFDAGIREVSDTFD